MKARREKRQTPPAFKGTLGSQMIERFILAHDRLDKAVDAKGRAAPVAVELPTDTPPGMVRELETQQAKPLPS
jgi:hypothetical protein